MQVMTIEAAAGQMLKLPRNNPKILEKAVKRLEPLLWPSHYVLLELNIALIFLYLDSRHRRPGEPRITFHLTNGRMHFVLVVDSDSSCVLLQPFRVSTLKYVL